jgi:parallel beta-helix repeat protein
MFTRVVIALAFVSVLAGAAITMTPWSTTGPASLASSNEKHQKERLTSTPTPTPTPTPTSAPTPTPTSAPVPTVTPTPTPTSTPTPTTLPAPTACSGVALSPSSDLQGAINSAPSGTTFCFAAGTYRASSLAPKAGDVLDGGNRRTVLDGGGTIQYAVVGSAVSPNVTVKGFTVQHYNNPLQHGAIESLGTTGWLIENNHVTLNAGAGITVDGGTGSGSGATTLNNLLDWNTQEGFTIHGDNVLFQGNEIAHNNPNLAVSPGWEAGGGKIWATQRATVRGNNSHDNGGPGLWTDGSDIYTAFDGNTVTNNWGSGILDEVSYDATITNNMISGNGFGDSGGWLWDGGITLSSSGALTALSPLVVSHNTLTNNFNGITLIQQNRGSGPLGPFLLQSVSVQGNSISGAGRTGAVADNGAVLSTRNLSWSSNTFANGASFCGLTC